MTQGSITINDLGPALEKCRADIAAFKRNRLITEAAMSGIIPCKATPEQFRAMLLRARDPLQERVAAEQLRDFMRMLLKREPTAEELRSGPPTLEELRVRLSEEGLHPPAGAADDGMGIYWLIPVVAAVGGAFGLSSVFSYLSGREAGLHRDLNIVTSTAGEARGWWNTAKAWALPAGLMVGVGGLLYFWASRKYDLKKAKAGQPKITVRPPRAELPPKSEMKQNAEDEDEGGEAEDAGVEIAAEEAGE
jgi:hypothetical protein